MELLVQNKFYVSKQMGKWKILVRKNKNQKIVKVQIYNMLFACFKDIELKHRYW